MPCIIDKKLEEVGKEAVMKETFVDDKELLFISNKIVEVMVFTEECKKGKSSIQLESIGLA